MIRKEYDYVQLSQEQMELVNKFRQRFSDLHSDIELFVADGYYRQAALDTLEGAALWLNKAISHDGIK